MADELDEVDFKGSTIVFLDNGDGTILMTVKIPSVEFEESAIMEMDFKGVIDFGIFSMPTDLQKDIIGKTTIIPSELEADDG